MAMQSFVSCTGRNSTLLSSEFPSRRNYRLLKSYCAVREASLVAYPATETVKRFYDAVNRRELEQAGELIAEECVYEDLVFSKPFVGRKDIVHFFGTFMDSISPDLKFVIDDIGDGDSSVGVTWHLDWRGKAFPFSKGCSFYRCKSVSGEYKIIYGRDCVEPAFKGDSYALKVIGAVTWLFEKFPWLASKL